MAEQAVLTDRDGDVLTLTLNCADRLNAPNDALLERLAAVPETVDETVRVVVSSGCRGAHFLAATT
jgi:enoyl-CoA hydratase/carnithine racemase